MDKRTKQVETTSVVPVRGTPLAGKPMEKLVEKPVQCQGQTQRGIQCSHGALAGTTTCQKHLFRLTTPTYAVSRNPSKTSCFLSSSKPIAMTSVASLTPRKGVCQSPVQASRGTPPASEIASQDGSKIRPKNVSHTHHQITVNLSPQWAFDVSLEKLGQLTDQDREHIAFQPLATGYHFTQSHLESLYLQIRCLQSLLQ